MRVVRAVNSVHCRRMCGVRRVLCVVVCECNAEIVCCGKCNAEIVRCGECNAEIVCCGECNAGIVRFLVNVQNQEFFRDFTAFVNAFLLV